jgi:hypothetical protein
MIILPERRNPAQSVTPMIASLQNAPPNNQRTNTPTFIARPEGVSRNYGEIRGLNLGSQRDERKPMAKSGYQSMNSKAGWTLALAGLLVLTVMRTLDMLIVLLPLAALLAYTISWIGRPHRKVTASLE